MLDLQGARFIASICSLRSYLAWFEKLISNIQLFVTFYQTIDILTLIIATKKVMLQLTTAKIIKRYFRRVLKVVNIERDSRDVLDKTPFIVTVISSKTIYGQWQNARTTISQVFIRRAHETIISNKLFFANVWYLLLSVL